MAEYKTKPHTARGARRIVACKGDLAIDRRILDDSIPRSASAQRLQTPKLGESDKVDADNTTKSNS
jgi:hypothetical protein